MGYTYTHKNNMVEMTDENKKVIAYLIQSPATSEILCFYSDKWQFNGDFDKPTFTPSMLLYAGNNNKREHFFVRDGKIEYLSDCEHEMAGKTVDMVACDW